MGKQIENAISKKRNCNQQMERQKAVALLKDRTAITINKKVNFNDK